MLNRDEATSRRPALFQNNLLHVAIRSLQILLDLPVPMGTLNFCLGASVIAGGKEEVFIWEFAEYLVAMQWGTIEVGLECSLTTLSFSFLSHPR